MRTIALILAWYTWIVTSAMIGYVFLSRTEDLYSIMMLLIPTWGLAAIIVRRKGLNSA